MIGRFRLANLVRFIPYLGGGRLRGRHRGSRVSGSHVPDGGRSGLAGDSGASGTFYVCGGGARARCMESPCISSMKRWRNALILPLSVALAVGAYHLVLAALDISGDEGESDWPSVHKHGGRKSVAILGTGRPGARELGRHGHADSQHADADTDLTHLCEHEFRPASKWPRIRNWTGTGSSRQRGSPV